MKDKWYMEKIKGENYIYHCFTFDPKIQEHTYLGNEFLGMGNTESNNVMNIFDRIVDAGPDGFMPKLVEELKNIFGEGNYKYDGHEIGEDDSQILEFNLYFLLKEKLYESLLEKVEKWSEYHGFRNLISWTPKDIS